MNPSVKTAADNAGLWTALQEGLIQVIATDHAPHTLEEKSAPYPKSPSGLPAVENSLALMLDQVHQGNATIEQVAAWMCDAPARVWDIVNKGRIEVGYDADLILVHLLHLGRRAGDLVLEVMVLLLVVGVELVDLEHRFALVQVGVAVAL